MKVLIACEESQVECIAFRAKGHEAFSCDLQECSGGHPEWHIHDDVLSVLNGNTGFYTSDGFPHFIDKWDLIIAHPPCTFLCVTGNRWFNEKRYGSSAVQRKINRELAIAFFMKFVYANCDKIVIENPVGFMSTCYRKPDQIIQPYQFGDPFEKRTCLWLKGVTPLVPSNIVSPPARKQFASGKTMPSWYADLFSLPKDERSRLRSKSFLGISLAMVDQWG